jgi:MoxR-like ATPase
MTAAPEITADAPAPVVATITPAPKAIDPKRAAVQAVEVALNAAFIERREEIRGIVVASLAREHVLLLGPAGTGKSALANAFCRTIDGAAFFQWLLTRFSAPEELFGPVSLSGLKADEFRRVTAGKLPEAHVAFLDEIYKANSAVLNSMLTAINEREFDNGKGRGSIPLETVIGASNEMAEGPELGALHDRFLLRFWVSYTRGRDSFSALLTRPEPSVPAGMITLDQLHQAQADVAALPLGAGVVDELFQLREELANAGIIASDRRWRKALRVLRAVSWLDGASEVSTEAFPVLSSCLWETPDQIAQLRQVVARYSAPQLSEAQEVVDGITGLVNNLPADTDDAYAQRVATVTREMKRAEERLAGLATTCAGRPSGEKINAMLTELRSSQSALRKKARESLGL